MIFLIHFVIAVISLFLIIYTCKLFTGAIEHLGNRLKLGNNAVGSIFAVIGTSLPETIVPLVAIFGAYIFKTDINTSKDIATGAIIGSPFMLSTLAMFLMGVFLLTKKRKQLNIDYKTPLRDYRYFIFAYILAISASYTNLKYLSVLILIVLYIVFVYRTIIKSKHNFIECCLDELAFSKVFKKSSLSVILAQIILSLFGLIIFSHFFVTEIKYFSSVLNLSPLILSLLITPFATELPECVNSIIWIKNDKDDLAIANVLGAIIFQSMIPFSIGILFTPWKFSSEILVNIILVILSSLIFTISVLISKKVSYITLISSGIFYLGFLIYLLF